MAGKRPYVLCIAAHDPSGGAGLTADIKTCEKNKAYGLSVCTGVTVQNDIDFKSTTWVSLADIKAQIDILFDRFMPHVAKIGLLKDAETLSTIVYYLKTKNPKIRIVLDPVCKASAGFSFSREQERVAWRNVCKELFLLTPNLSEKELLCPEVSIADPNSVADLACYVYLKGGHSETDLGKDYLFYKQKIYPYRSSKGKFYEKHGSGCILSSAIATFIARGFPVVKACQKSKNYIEKVLKSNPSLLGYHYE